MVHAHEASLVCSGMRVGCRCARRLRSRFRPIDVERIRRCDHRLAARSRSCRRPRSWPSLRRSARRSGRTTRKPTNSASVKYQMLCGICGSCCFQSLFEPRRAALRSCSGSSSHEPPRTACGYSFGREWPAGSSPPCRRTARRSRACTGRAPTRPRCRACRAGPRDSASSGRPSDTSSSLLSKYQAYSPSLRRIVAERVGRRRAGAAGVFPFGLGRQAIVAAGLGAEPLAVRLGGELRHADRRDSRPCPCRRSCRCTASSAG